MAKIVSYILTFLLSSLPAFAGPWINYTELPEIYCLELMAAGKILAISQTTNSLFILDSYGKSVAISETPGTGRNSLLAPSEADSRLGMTIILADRNNRRLSLFDRHLAYRGGLEIPERFEDDLQWPELLAVSATQSIAVLDKINNGLLLLEPGLDNWRLLFDFSRSRTRLDPLGMETVNETVFLFCMAEKNQRFLLSIGTVGGSYLQEEYPGLLAIHRSADDEELLLLEKLPTEELRIRSISEEYFEATARSPVIIHLLPALSNSEIELRDFLLTETGLLICSRSGKLSFLPREHFLQPIKEKSTQ
jgi:hypothetical protein